MQGALTQLAQAVYNDLTFFFDVFTIGLSSLWRSEISRFAESCRSLHAPRT